jgi:Fe-S-cluster containining protein
MKKFEIRINKKGLPPSLIVIEIPNGDIRFIDLIPSLYLLFDKIIEAELKSHTTLSCCKECSECCNQLIPISIPEAFFLNNLVKSLSNKKRVKLNHRFGKIMSMLRDAGLAEDLLNLQNNHHIDVDYFNMRMGCPFLEDGLCSIYKYRPFVCREYYVTSEAAYCSNLDTDHIQKVKISRNMGALTAAFAARLHGLQPAPIPLVLFPDWIKENTSLETKKWPGIWLFDKITHCLISLNDEDLKIQVDLIK